MRTSPATDTAKENVINHTVVSSLVIEKEVLKALEEALGSNSIVYEMREIRPQELSNERTL